MKDFILYYQIRSDFLTSETFRNQGLFLRNQFQGEGIFEIPIVKKQHVNVETITLIGYDHVNRKKKNLPTQWYISFWTIISSKCYGIILSPE